MAALIILLACTGRPLGEEEVDLKAMLLELANVIERVLFAVGLPEGPAVLDPFNISGQGWSFPCLLLQRSEQPAGPCILPICFGNPYIVQVFRFPRFDKGYRVL